MSSKAGALLLIAGICLMAASIPRRHPHAPARRVHKTERPWLTRDAQDQLIGENGAPGPLFAGVTLGGLPPTQDQRDAIAQFANANAVDIELEVRDDTLTAIRASVTFGGCCGYEAVDVLGRRLSRPHLSLCVDCDDYVPVDDWAYEPEHGVHVSFHTHVNTLAVRWEPALSTDEALDAVEAIVGERIDKLKRAAGDRLTEREPHEYLLGLPYDASRPAFEGTRKPGMAVRVHAGVITEVELDVFIEGDEESRAPIEKLLRARFGRPRIDAETGAWTWHHDGHAIAADLCSYDPCAHMTITPVMPSPEDPRLAAIREMEANGHF